MIISVYHNKYILDFPEISTQNKLKKSIKTSYNTIFTSKPLERVIIDITQINKEIFDYKYPQIQYILNMIDQKLLKKL